MSKINNLIAHYKAMSEERRQTEIDALFDIIFAMLEATACDSMETYPNANIKISFRCEVINDQSRYYQ